jgi:hypothetical protein
LTVAFFSYFSFNLRHPLKPQPIKNAIKPLLIFQKISLYFPSFPMFSCDKSSRDYKIISTAFS